MDLLNIPTIEQIHPSAWGKSTWQFIETIIATYPRDSPSIEHRDHVYHFLDSLGYLLPCADCRNHYKSFIKRHSIGDALTNRITLLHFYYHLRLEVAARSNETLHGLHSIEDVWKNILTRFNLHGMTRNNIPMAGRNVMMMNFPRPVQGCATCHKK